MTAQNISVLNSTLHIFLSRESGTETLDVYIHIICNSAILSNNYVLLLIDLCTCVQMKKMALQMKWLWPVQSTS